MGEPFQIERLASVLNHAQALQLAGEYKRLVGGDAVDTIWSDFQLSASRHLYFITDVQVPADGIHHVTLGHGPEGDYFAEIRAAWSIVAIRV